MIDWLRPRSAQQDRPLQLEVGRRSLPIAIKRHRTAKRLILRLAPDGSEIRVTMPRWGQSADALEFARSRQTWLEAQLQGVEEIAPPGPGGDILFCGTPIRIAWDPAARRKPRLAGSELMVGGPEEGLHGRIERWLRAEGLSAMERDLAHYCAVAGVPKPKLALSRAQRRWGSCSSSGTVRINWRLIMAPEQVRRSVVAHEVAHLVHFDHSAAFYALLDDIFEGDMDGANAWLKAKGRSLYSQFG
ncbi:M48 family metallopeptidase [Pontixanthobacter aquaemixtae]|uniref:DUF45 domain-containing protein n=1 Tax=Pontixanthobacter aquaemixtae TaxID=1958940 RepID=A0A844ZUV7_9SPHN|nr:SprT family zinc-dependent metalloprotease [Pontixanthobacter aquaemixtae]MXO89329.1 DUF45 domain-containing protein [Pontixanthobacter aquaemixtae]